MTYDINEIKEAFDKVLCCSQGLSSVKTNNIFKKWEENKKFYLEHWDGPILEVGEVQFTLDEEKQQELFKSFVDFLIYNMKNEPMANFVVVQGSYAFFNNIVFKDYPLSDDKTIPKGMKLMKALKYFEQDQEALEYIQNKGSSYIQENCIKGTLCFSVHPLDFLSLSENPYHWRSCHALDGDYRLGNLSYMMDSSTVICYLRGANNTYLDRFPDDVPWNGKKWRCLMFFSNGHSALFAGRQYPFFAPGALDIIQPALLNSLCKNIGGWTPWCNTHLDNIVLQNGEVMELNKTYIPIRNELKALQDIIIDAESSHHYNDLLYSSCYEPYYCWDNWSYNEIKLLVGYNTPCVCCGEAEVNETDTMICEECFDQEDDPQFSVSECNCCGNFVPTEMCYWIENEEALVCPTCFNENYKQCEYCDEIVRKEDIIWDKTDRLFICYGCAQEKGIET